MKLAPHLPIKYGFPQTNGEDGYHHWHDGFNKTDASSSSRHYPPPVPKEAQGVGHFFKSFDARLWMFYRHWEPAIISDEKPIKATLMILHGTVDHSGVYEELAKTLNQIGVAVIGMDMRGWGLSDGESMYFNDTDSFVEDLHTLYTRIHDAPNYRNVVPRFLLGKSLGGLITAYAVEKYPTHWTGLLGLSGAYTIDPKNTISPLAIFILKMVALCLPKLPIKPPFDEHLIVSDPQALEKWRKDPLCCKDRLKIGYGIEILRAADALPSTLSAVTKIPILMMIGSQDQVVTRDGHQLLVDLNQTEDKQLVVYQDGRHNLLQEPFLKDAVMTDIVRWIQARSICINDSCSFDTTQT